MMLLPQTRIVIVDDHQLYRIGLRAVIAKMCNTLSIIGECATSAEFNILLQQNIIPDLVILDIKLPDGNGINIAHHLKHNYPQVKIIMLSSEVSEEIINNLLEIDVEGYLSKMAQMIDVEKAINTVLSGSHFYGQSVTKMMYDIYVSKSTMVAKENPYCSKEERLLSSREIEIVRLLCDGYSAKIIGSMLNLSSRTVETHRNNIMKKMGFSNIAELIKYAVKHGMVEWE